MILFIKSLFVLFFSSTIYGQIGELENLSPSQLEIIKKNSSQFSPAVKIDDIKDQIINETVKNKRISNEDLIKDVENQLPIDKSVNFDDSDIDAEVIDSDIVEDDSDIVEDSEELDDIEENNTQNSESVKPSSRYFGYDIFESDPEYFQKSSINALDPDYLIGPGDEIIVMLWGQTQFQESYIVSKEGYIFVENLGQVFVNGLVLETLEKKLFKLLSKVYSSLKGGPDQASTFLDVSLGSMTLRSLRVFVLGEVRQPGAYLINPNSTLFTSLYYFNGPTTSGSLREIILIRSNKEVAKIDFYDFLLFGKKDNDMRLKKDDVIFIPKRGKSVSIEGEIHKPFIYELKKGEGIEHLISMAGGILPTTYMNHAQIKRIIPADERNKSGIDRTIVDINLGEVINDKVNIKLIDQDEISFYKISDVISNIVTVNGAVKRPGVYDFANGLNVLDLINKSDGVLGTAYLKKADITRDNIDNTKDFIEIDLSKALENDPLHNKKLNPGDVLNVYDFYSMKYRSDVSITGHVKNPNTYEFQNGMTIADLIFLGGGFEDDMHLLNTHTEKSLLSRLVENSLEKELIFFSLDSVLQGMGIADERLKMGDEILVYSKDEIQSKLPTTVSIEGFVKKPGQYNLYQDMRLGDLLELSGGQLDTNFTRKIYDQRVDLFRTNYSNDQIEIINIDLNNKFSLDLRLKNGDNVRVYSKNLFTVAPVVNIEGIIRNPGQYNYKNQMSIYDLILDAGGVESSYKNIRVELYRKGTDLKNRENLVKTFLVKNDLSILQNINHSKSDKNILLKPKDVIIVRPEDINVDFQRVNISGLVRYPGDYIILNSDENINDIILRAGGILDEANLKNSFFTRNERRININIEKIVKNPRSRSNFPVVDGDQIFIGGKSQIVEIRGEVNSPGLYQYYKGYRYNDYVKLAGGYTSDASKFSSYVISPDGRSTKIKIHKPSPKIFDGTIINVGRKEEYVPFNFTEYVTNLTSIYADLTQAYLMILVATRAD